MFSLWLLVITLIAVAFSFHRDRARTWEALRRAAKANLSLLPGILGMTALIGLVLALLPPTLLTDLFRSHGIAGFLLISFVGALVTMPAPIAYPLAGALLQKGVSLAALAAFITTLTMVGVVSAPLEIAHFGKRFTLVRQSLSFGLALAIGLLMGVLLR